MIANDDDFNPRSALIFLKNKLKRKSLTEKRF